MIARRLALALAPAAAVFAAFYMAAFSPPAAAQSGLCDRRSEVLAQLAENYGEVPTGEQGLSDAGAVVEVLVSPEGSWTLILTNATGISCLMATGQDWEGKRPPPPPEEGKI